MAEKITDLLVRGMKSPAAGNRIVYDSEVRGFGVRITAAGARAFVLNYRVDGAERRLTIGAYPDWSVAAAREQAKALKREVDRGSDPLARRKEDR
ncbi:MAG TPA: Arm DNA-binding domain-containing protein, partial [Alphaproteobacteria bacterium]|nr:Arm DNA-binding domain-containing protein [Alphaproteobacteria bacterium]